MKIILLFSLVLFSRVCIAQQLDGTWFGYFTSGPRGEWKVPIGLEVTKNPDSSYKIRSYSKYVDVSGKDSIIVCDVSFSSTKTHIILEETSISVPESFAILQKMFLKFKKNTAYRTLTGWWIGVNDPKREGGDIFFGRMD